MALKNREAEEEEDGPSGSPPIDKRPSGLNVKGT